MGSTSKVKEKKRVARQHLRPKGGEQKSTVSVNGLITVVCRWTGRFNEEYLMTLCFLFEMIEFQ